MTKATATTDRRRSRKNENGGEGDADGCFLNLSCYLRVKFGGNYPEDIPDFEILGLENRLPKDRLILMEEFVTETAEENTGMAMVFTVVSALQEHLIVLSEQFEAERLAVIERKIEEAAESERRRLEGTPVTVETFMAWKRMFDEERLNSRTEKEREKLSADSGGRLTGKEQFLKDATLNLSDLKLLEETEDAIKIDESLFEDLDELDLEDQEDE